jgi:hypothetical protein
MTAGANSEIAISMTAIRKLLVRMSLSFRLTKDIVV